jgi:shikimate kinase
MGAGKTCVGAHVASSLGWRFVDFDDVIEAEAGMGVARLFEAHGEEAFRALEARVGERLLGQERVVLAAGGGWAAVDGRLAELPAGTATFWLKVSARTALERVATQSGKRPLLRGPDASVRAADLLAERLAHYGQARWAVDTEGSTVEDVSAWIAAILAAQYPEQAPNER